MNKSVGKGKIVGESYKRRVLDVNAIYDKYAKSGLSNREIQDGIFGLYILSRKGRSTTW